MEPDLFRKKGSLICAYRVRKNLGDRSGSYLSPKIHTSKEGTYFFPLSMVFSILYIPLPTILSIITTPATINTIPTPSINSTIIPLASSNTRAVPANQGDISYLPPLIFGFFFIAVIFVVLYIHLNHN